MSLEQNLIAIRDAAHLNSGALAAVGVQAQEQYDTVRAEWTDSDTKRGVLTQLAAVLQAYRNGAREAGELRDRAAGALSNLTDTPPPLPDSSSSEQNWSVESW